MFNFVLDEKSEMRKVKREKKEKRTNWRTEKEKKKVEEKKNCPEWQVWNPQTIWKILSDDKWVMVPNECDILKWLMISNEWRVMGDKWRKLSDEKKPSDQPLNHPQQFS